MLLAPFLVPLALAAPPHHQLKVRLDPAGHALAVSDTLALGDLPPDDDGAWHFTLHAGLAVRAEGRGWTLAPEPLPADVEAEVPLEAWKLTRARRASPTVTLAYGGALDHPLAPVAEDYQRGFSTTPGTISEQGVYLAGSSAWVPDLGDALFTYDLAVVGLPVGWDAVSQGERTLIEHGDGGPEVIWVQRAPTEEAHLVAGAFAVTTAPIGNVTFRAYLRSADPGLAYRYQQATARTLALYETLIGPYPAGSFAVVENAWETGYGMPGFTLLGPQVLRMPWVLATSYPHEILHAWWGNSVYVAEEGGNWCEGLTSYLADHLLAEQKGEGIAHRRALLQKYADFVGDGQDFPLAAFGERASAASEAVGYGKSAMLFHMLRLRLGDEAFTGVLRGFYADFRFRRAAWSDLARAFDAAEPGLGAFVTTWVQRPGAPRLAVERAEVHPADAHPFAVALTLAQVQEAEAFPVRVPVAVTLEGRDEPAWFDVDCAERACKAVLPCDARPLRLDVDPRFDLMRALDPREVPPALSTVQGDEAALFVLPAAASADEQAAWRALAAGWTPGARVALDSEIESLPAGGAWVLGAGNRFGPVVQRALMAQGVVVDAERLQVGGERMARAGHSLVLIARASEAPAAAWAWLSADPVAAVPGLGRKLPHYGRYGWLAFEGPEPTNVAKGQWEAGGSPLTRGLAEVALPALAVSDRGPLARQPPRFAAESLGAWVDRLADPALKGRGLGSPGLLAASDLVADEFFRLGLSGGGDDGGFRQRFEIRASSLEDGAPAGAALPGSNFVARLPGTDPGLAPVLVMAHLDHLGLGGPLGDAANLGKVHPGADDNASGVAVLLGLAGVLAAEPARERTVLLAVTTAEEVGAVGAKALVAALGERKPFACLNLDTVGRLLTGKLYALNASSAREWPFILMGAGYGLGLHVAIAPEPLDASDDQACLQAGIPAVQLFTGPHADYHQPTDTPDKVDRAGLATVADVAWQVVDYLAGRREPLTAAQATGGGHPGGPPGERKVSLGTTPDFAFGGPGVRVQEVRAGSPAAAAGIRAGDVLLAVDGRVLGGLKDLSAALKGHAAGDAVVVRVSRDGAQIEVTATLEER